MSYYIFVATVFIFVDRIIGIRAQMLEESVVRVCCSCQSVSAVFGHGDVMAPSRRPQWTDLAPTDAEYTRPSRHPATVLARRKLARIGS